MDYESHAIDKALSQQYSIIIVLGPVYICVGGLYIRWVGGLYKSNPGRPLMFPVYKFPQRVVYCMGHIEIMKKKIQSK